MNLKTQHSTRPVIKGMAVVIVVGAALALSGCNNGSTSGSGMPTMGTSAQPSAQSSGASTASNDADVTFTQMMIPHHQQAVQMSDMMLAKSGVSADVRSLATQIKAAQQPEIAMMTGWLSSWGQGMGGMDGMSHNGEDGMMTAESMKQMDQAAGPAGTKLYLEGMVKHHQGAVAAAEAEIRDGKNPDAIKLAKNVVATQKAEITTMQAMLAKL